MAKKYFKPEDNASDELVEEENDHLDVSEAETRVKSMSKAKAARVALAEGVVVPKEASIYIKRKFGIDISPQQFSAEKSRLKLRSGSDLDSSAKRIDGYLAPPSKRTLTGDADLLQALEAIKPLIAQLGVDKVKRMVDLLG